jgi:molybdopterin converting factor small subunit
MKIAVTLKIFSLLRVKYGFTTKDITCENRFSSFLQSCERELGRDFVDLFYDLNQLQVKEKYLVLLNGNNIVFQSKDPELHNGDMIAIFPPAAGG